MTWESRLKKYTISLTKTEGGVNGEGGRWLKTPPKNSTYPKEKGKEGCVERKGGEKRGSKGGDEVTFPSDWEGGKKEGRRLISLKREKKRKERN